METDHVTKDHGPCYLIWAFVGYHSNISSVASIPVSKCVLMLSIIL